MGSWIPYTALQSAPDRIGTVCWPLPAGVRGVHVDVFRHDVVCPLQPLPWPPPAHAVLHSSLPVLGASMKPWVQPAQTAAGDEAAPLPHRPPSALQWLPAPLLWIPSVVASCGA